MRSSGHCFRCSFLQRFDAAAARSKRFSQSRAAEDSLEFFDLLRMSLLAVKIGLGTPSGNACLYSSSTSASFFLRAEKQAMQPPVGLSAKPAVPPPQKRHGT